MFSKSDLWVMIKQTEQSAGRPEKVIDFPELKARKKSRASK